MYLMNAAVLVACVHDVEAAWEVAPGWRLSLDLKRRFYGPAGRLWDPGCSELLPTLQSSARSNVKPPCHPLLAGALSLLQEL